MGTSARKVNENYRDKFLAIRKQWAEEHIPHLAVASAPASTAEPTPHEKETKNSSRLVESAPITDHIQTSRFRNNVLHDYEEGYRPVTAVICLMDTDEYKVLDDDDWQDYRLKLAVHEDEED